MNKNHDEFKNTSHFEFQYDDLSKSRADVRVGDINYEFKSWTSGTPNPWKGFFDGTNGSYKQFLNYLRNTNKIENLRYVFNGSKTSEKQVKDAFKMLFEKKKTEIFEKMNSDLKKSLEIRKSSDLDESKINEILNQLIKE